MRALRPATIWLLLALSVAFVWVVVGIPAWHIQPFRPQSDLGMEWSYALRRRGPLLSAAGVAVAAVIAAWGWPARPRVGARLGVLALLGLALAPAWFVRQNHFEWMFAPLGQVAYAAASEAIFLSDAEMVMGVQAGAAAVAFPVRQLAYHHVVNTEVADEPVVATY